MTETRRIRFTVQYDGGAFWGWQLQPGQRTVQGELERAAGRLFDAPVRVAGSGRTDRGVHALGQVAALPAPPRWTPATFRRSMNALLPPDVWIADAGEAPAGFDPRRHPVRRDYRYRVGTGAGSASPFLRRWCWPLGRPLDAPAMQRAADVLPGEHSFRGFAKAGQEHRGDRCTVLLARWEPWDEAGLEFRISANRFLHHMVRYLVGTLVHVGLGVRPEADVAALLAGAPALKTSPPAPPQGLFLAAVHYPEP